MKITMTGRLTQCILLAYRTPAAGVAHLLPAGLRPLTRGEWAFWNVVACRVECMRPRGLPALAGLSYFHVAYRLYVRAMLADGRELQGLYFVRSDADSTLIAATGNLMTDFRFHRAAIAAEETPAGGLRYDVRTPEGVADLGLSVVPSDDAHAAPDTCFPSPDAARAFLHYQPLGLSVSARGTKLRVAEVLRDESAWRETPLRVERADVAFLDHLGQREARLELATLVAPIAYRWRLGRRERLAPA